MKKIAILSYSNLSFFELACAVELFVLKRPEIPNWYQADVVTFEQGTLRSNIGLGISGCKPVSGFAGYDMIVIPSWPPSQSEIPPTLARALIRANKQGKRILSFCSGAFLLARLGLLEGRKATTHWRYAEAFSQTFPDIEYVANVLYIYEDNIGTAAGSASALDLGLDVIREDFGSKAANKVARRMVVAAHRSGGQAQFVESAINRRPDLLAETLDWAIKNLATITNVNQLAERACMSRRTFDRRFRASMNLAPQSWLIDQRIAVARELLESTSCSIDQLAIKVGFETPETLRHHFRKRLGLSPMQYRLNFREAG